MRFLILLCILILVCTLSVQAARKFDYKEGRVPAQEFVILPWGNLPLVQGGQIGFWGTAQSYDEIMKDLWECGFNASGFAPFSVLPYAKKYGMAMIAQDGLFHQDIPYEQMLQEAKKKLAPYKNNPALLGIYLQDEPNSSRFEFLGKWAKAITAADPKIWPYINLYPNYASNAQLGADSYADYVDKFVAACQPKFLSYDNYSLVGDGNLMEKRFYTNLEEMRDKSLQYNLPFWNIVLGNAHFTYSEPSQATIYVQVYSSLAYGARGISYFTYYCPVIGNYRLAAKDQFGNRTKTWDYIRLMNLQIHKLAPTYLKLRSTNVFHAGSVPEGSKGIEDSRYVDSVTGGNYVVGEFIGPKEVQYALVVNKSTKDSVLLDIKFKDPGTVMAINSYTGTERGFDGENRWLAPGQGMLLFLKKE